jgi:flagellar biosynthetic protein FliR
MPVTLLPILDHLPAWLMVLFRLSGIFIFAPLLGATTVPARVKVCLAVGLSLCIYPMLLSPGRAAAPLITSFIDSPMHLWALVGAVAIELLIGLVIGYGASLPLIAAQVGGQVIDQQMGMAIAGVFNPELGEQSGIVGEFFFLTALAIFIMLGGHRIMLVTLAGSFDHVPLGAFNDFHGLMMLVTGLLSSMFELALRVAAPLLAVIFLETVAMGFIARTVPQMNIMSMGFALRIMVGLSVLAAIVGVQMQVVTDSIRRTLDVLRLFFAA